MMGLVIWKIKRGKNNSKVEINLQKLYLYMIVYTQNSGDFNG